MGRPSEFTQEIADAICERLSEGESLRTICLDDGMPSRGAVFRWLSEREAFQGQYARAREAQAEFYAESTVDISDEIEVEATYQGEEVKLDISSSAVARNRLRIDARKWYASKMAPKKFGDIKAIELSGSLKVQSVTDLSDDDLAAIATSGGN